MSDKASPSSQAMFPPLSQVDEDGLLMRGGDLTVPWLLAAYRQGIFPWPLDTDGGLPVAWWCPDPRAVIELEQFHISRSLRRVLRKRRFEVTFDRDFLGVIEGCAANRDADDGSWITPPLIDGFIALHETGHAHSVEVWYDGDLIGGVYGVAVGRYFSAESMFHRRTDASKVALAHLIEHLTACEFTLIDIQQINSHTRRLGASEISRDEFLRRHAEAVVDGGNRWVPPKSFNW